MKNREPDGFRLFPRIRLVSPSGFLLLGVLIVAVYAVCELAGLREFTTFLSGTSANTALGLGTSAALGTTYMLAYFACVLGTPVLLAASGVFWLTNRRLASRSAAPTPRPSAPQITAEGPNARMN